MQKKQKNQGNHNSTSLEKLDNDSVCPHHPNVGGGKTFKHLF